MSKNCLNCGVRDRTGHDLLCDQCRCPAPAAGPNAEAYSEVTRIGKLMELAESDGRLTGDQWRALSDLLTLATLVQRLDPRVKERGVAPASDEFFGLVANCNGVQRTKRESLKAVASLLASVTTSGEQASRLRHVADVATRLFGPGAGDGWWGKVKAWVVHGAPTREQGIEAVRQITRYQLELADAVAKAGEGRA